ncbi:MAG TPA: ATP-binding protein [Acidimicrobiales bacterium]|nr:ATP-binding protein [Acidimicrobiales bacterium]
MALSALVAVALVLAVAASVVAIRAVRARSALRRQAAELLGPLVGAPPEADAGAVVTLAASHIGALSERSARAEHIADRLTDALSTVPEGVVLCDEHGQVWFRNEVAQLFAGARHGEVLADLTVTELLDAALRAAPEAQYPSQYLELYGPPRRTLLIRAIPLREEGQLLGAVAVIEDVSDRRRLEAVRRDFVANVSHELKSPVGALGILAEAMQLEDEPAVSRRLAERMQTEAFRVARIIDDLLDLSRIESEETPQREPLAVHTVVAQAVERIRPVAEHRGVTIDVSEGPRRLTVVGDRRQLVSAVHNLLDNAVKYSDDGSVVEVRIRSSVSAEPPDAAWAEISIEDHGIGIPSRDLERIFERFYRVDRARARDTGGTGLGLAIVRHVATNHRGEVTVSSHEGQGSVFTLRLPAGPGPVVLTTPHQEAG